MRKWFITLLMTGSLMMVLAGTSANAGCITLNEQSSAGSLTGQVCLSSTAVSLNEVEVMVAATGKTYTINGTGTISGTRGNYKVSGTVTITDGTNTETVTVTSSGSNLIVAASGFIEKTLTLTLQL